MTSQDDINAYLSQQLAECKTRIAVLEEESKNRIKWGSTIVTPKPQFRKWLCDTCNVIAANEIWFNGNVFCSEACRIQWIGRGN